MYNILFLTTRFPYPPDDGGKIDTLSNLKILSKNYDIFLFYIGSRNKGERDFKRYIVIQGLYNCPKDIKNNLFGIFKNMFCKIPYTISKYHDYKIYKKIEEIIKINNIGIVFVDHLHMAFYGKLIKERFPEIKVILREHNTEYIFWRRIFREEKNILKKFMFWWQYLKVLKYEREITNIFDKCFMISPMDQINLKKINSNAKTVVIPTFVEIKNCQLSQTIEVVPYSMLYLGNFSWLPNLQGLLWFLREVWPEIFEEFPDAKIFVVGKNPPDEIIGFKSKNIIVTGYVNDVKPWIAKAEIFLVPLFSGGGIRIKILEAMAMGKPIISTSIGAEGIGVSNMKNIIISDNKENFIKSIKLLFNDKKIRDNLSKNSRKLIEEKYSFEVVEKALTQAIENL